MDWGLTALATQCKTGSSFLLGTRCRVGGDSCLTLGVRGVKHCIVVMCMGLTALARRCKISFSFLPGTRCLVGEEACLTLVVRGVSRGVQAELEALSLRIGLG